MLSGIVITGNLIYFLDKLSSIEEDPISQKALKTALVTITGAGIFFGSFEIIINAVK